MAARRLVKRPSSKFGLLLLQGKFSKKPFVFLTVAHHHAGLKRDAASVWLENITTASCRICLRELENYAGSHEDIYVVSETERVCNRVLKTNLIKFAIIWVKRRQKAAFLSPISSKITETKEKERRKREIEVKERRRREKSNGCALSF